MLLKGQTNSLVKQCTITFQFARMHYPTANSTPYTMQCRMQYLAGSVPYLGRNHAPRFVTVPCLSSIKKPRGIPPRVCSGTSNLYRCAFLCKFITSTLRELICSFVDMHLGDIYTCIHVYIATCIMLYINFLYRFFQCFVIAFILVKMKLYNII